MTRLLLGTALAFTLALPVAADEASNPDRDADAMLERLVEIEMLLSRNPDLVEDAVVTAIRARPAVVKEIIRDTLLRNPEIVVGALKEFQRATAAGQARAIPEAGDDALSADYLDRVRQSVDAPVLGNPDGTVTIVEFFDYNCRHCRNFSGELDRLIADNPDLRVVMRHWPILGEDSVEVARIALASQAQGAFARMHAALMSQPGEVDSERAMKLAGILGLDTNRLAEDAQDPLYWAHIEASDALAQEAALEGTPGLVVDDQRVPGFVPARDLQPIIDDAVVE